MRNLAALALLLAPAVAGAQAFHPGPVFPDIAPIATIANDLPVPAGAVLKVTYDVTGQAPVGEANRSFETAARFINTHVEAGVPEKNINVAYVVHGKAILDLLKPAAYATRAAAKTDQPGKANGSAAMIARLQAHNVTFYVCGQSAVAQGVAKADLLPGIKMAISASSAHALLGMAGYTLIPF